MALDLYLQDANLQWLRGIPFPPPPAQLWMSLHSDVDATAGADVSSVLGGRAKVNQEFLSEPLFLDGESSGTRQIVNLKAALSQLAAADVAINSFALWNAQIGGIRLLIGTVTPTAEVRAGDPAVLLQGALSIRMI